MSEQLTRLLDERAITQQIHRYARGVDRMDRELARACWHDDGSADYRGMFVGTADALLDWMWRVHTAMQAHSHQMSNILIELDGDRAASETYVTVALRTGGDSPLDIFTRGRYLDRWSKRGETWAIDHRIHVADHTTTHGVPSRIPVEPSGTRDRSDPSYRLLS